MPTVSLVSKPSMSASCAPLQVRQQEVITAYFAKRITEEESGGIKVKFEETKNAKIGEEVYIVIETQNLQGEELVINILQGKENVLADMGEAITVQVAGTDTSEIKATVGYCGDNENITNETDFEDWAVAKITLQPKEETKQEEWTECLNTATEKKANLSLLIDAHTKHTLPNLKPQYILYRGEKGEDDNTDLCNHFLNCEGAFFEVEEVSCCDKLTMDELDKVFPRGSVADKTEIMNAFNDANDKFGLDSCYQKAHFFAQVKQEVGAGINVKDGEGLNYSAEALPKHFKAFRKKVDGVTIPTKEAYLYGRSAKNNNKANQEMIANIAYAGKNGNSDVESGDGWKYRGRGIIQITGKGKYKKINSAIKRDFPEFKIIIDPYNINNIYEGTVASMGYWKEYGCQKQAAKGVNRKQLDAIVNIVNSITKSREKRWGNLQEMIKIFKVNECQTIK